MTDVVSDLMASMTRDKGMVHGKFYLSLCHDLSRCEYDKSNVDKLVMDLFDLSLRYELTNYVPIGSTVRVVSYALVLMRSEDGSTNITSELVGFLAKYMNGEET